MTGLPGDVWARLARTPASAEQLTARPAVREICERVLAAIDSRNQRHILVQLAAEDAPLEAELRVRGLSASTRELGMSGRRPGRYIDVVCHDASGHAAFDVVARELVDAMGPGNVEPASLVARVIGRWQRFWGQPPGERLSREEILGLFAELWFLSRWVIPHYGPEGVNAWRGPFGARHDFEWRNQSVEVKATTSNRGRIFVIHGLEQLLAPERGALLLFGLRLREERGANATLPGVVEDCRRELASDPASLGTFESALSAAGYDLEAAPDYETSRLRLVDGALYRVTGPFPRLTPETFPVGAPAGIERVSYEINLDGFHELTAASEPGGWTS